MKIINIANVESKEVAMDPLFFGGKVFSQFVLEEEHTSAVRIYYFSNSISIFKTSLSAES